MKQKLTALALALALIMTWPAAAGAQEPVTEGGEDTQTQAEIGRASCRERV